MKNIKRKLIGMNPDFTYRGEAQTRIETLSDAIFAIAIALLVLSSSIPETFDELIASLDDLAPFAISITLLMLVWYQHYIFFIRYGLQDAKTVLQNTILLFLILFYVYPLKFLFQVLSKLFVLVFTQDQEAYRILFTEVMSRDDGPSLMIIYGIGAASIFLVLAWMYHSAAKRREELELTDREYFDTRTSVHSNLLMAAVPIVSLLIAWIGIGGKSTAFTLSGFAYWLYMIVMPIYGKKRQKRRDKIFDSAVDS